MTAADKLVNSTLSQNSDVVASVANGDIGGAQIEAAFDSPTGKEAFASSPQAQPYIRTTYGVRVVIAYNPWSDKGFDILTAFPINR